MDDGKPSSRPARGFETRGTPSSITLIPVADRGEEQAVLERVAEGGGRPIVVPVLDTDGLLGRVEQVLEAYGVPTTRATLDTLGDLPQRGVEPPEDGAGAGIGAVVVSQGVDADLVRLATTLTSAPALGFPVDAASLDDALEGRPRRVLWLFDPHRTPPSEAMAFASAATKAAVDWGIVLVSSSSETRYALLKTSLIAAVETTDLYRFSSTAYPIPNAPAGLVPQLEDSSAPKRSDVLLLAGHANMLDASIAADAVLCAREGVEGRMHGTDLPSCFNGGRCYRQPEEGPQRQLLGLEALSTKILVLSGCFVAPLGEHWARGEATLAHQFGQGHMAALITSTALSIGSYALDLLCLGLLMEGRTLGEVVTTVNRIRRDRLSQPNGLPAHVGPFVLHGNPSLRLVGSKFPPAAVRRCGSPDEVCYEITVTVPPGADRIFTGVSLPPSIETSYAVVRGVSEESWVMGYRLDEADSSTLYLQLGVPEPIGGPVSVTIDFIEHDPAAVLRNTIAGWWSTLSFWELFVSDAEAEYQRLGRATDQLAGVRGELAEVSSVLAQYLATLQVDPGILIASWGIDAGRDTMFRLLDHWSRQMLDLVADISKTTGRITSCGEPPFLHPSEPIRSALPCPCGGNVYGQVFRGPGGSPVRVHRQCHLCGNSRDEDSGAVLEWWNDATLQYRAGEPLQCRIRGRVPEDRHLDVHLVCTLETWEKDGQVVGPAYHAVFPAGSSVEAELTLDVPRELVPGVYPVGVLGIINGSLVSMRRSLSISAAAQP